MKFDEVLRLWLNRSRTQNEKTEKEMKALEGAQDESTLPKVLSHVGGWKNAWGHRKPGETRRGAHIPGWGERENERRKTPLNVKRRG